MSTVPTALPKPKSRRRRWFWIIGGFVLLVVLTPVLVSVIAGWWGERQMQALYAEIDAEDPNWRWPDLCASLQPRPGEPNSTDQIVKLRALLAIWAFTLPPNWDGEATQKILQYRNAQLNAEQTTTLRTAFAALDPTTLAEARKLKDMPAGRYPLKVVNNPYFTPNDEVQNSRIVFYLLQHDAMMRGQDKEYDGAIESSQALLNSARPLREHPTIIALLVHIAGQAIAIESIERALGQGEASDDALKKLQEQLEADAAVDGLHQALRGERAMGHQIYQSVRDGKMSLADFMGGMGSGGGEGRILDFFSGFILNSYPEYLRLMTEQVKIAKLKDVERDEAFGAVQQEVHGPGEWQSPRHRLPPADAGDAKGRGSVAAFASHAALGRGRRRRRALSAQARSVAERHEGAHSRRFNQGRVH